MVPVSKKYILLCLLALSLCNFGCATEKKVEATLQPQASVVVSSPAPSSSLTSTPLFVELSLDMYAYPRAIATQEDIVLEAEDPSLKRDAQLTLVALHMNRVNPNQDFFAASAALSQAVDVDPLLLENLQIKRWLDVFALMHEMQDGYNSAGQLTEQNQALRVENQKQKCSINYLETTLEELKKVEQDVENKKRLYR